MVLLQGKLTCGLFKAKTKKIIAIINIITATIREDFFVIRLLLPNYSFAEVSIGFAVYIFCFLYSFLHCL